MAEYDGRGYGDLKKDLAEVLAEFVTPLRELSPGGSTTRPGSTPCSPADRARSVAADTVRAVYDRVGFLPLAH